MRFQARPQRACRTTRPRYASSIFSSTIRSRPSTKPSRKVPISSWRMRSRPGSTCSAPSRQACRSRARALDNRARSCQRPCRNRVISPRSPIWSTDAGAQPRTHGGRRRSNTRTTCSRCRSATRLDFFRGDARMLRDRIARALPSWSDNVPGYHAMLGMQAFGLEETGDYARSREGRPHARSSSKRATPGRSTPSRMCMEMQGRHRRRASPG